MKIEDYLNTLPESILSGQNVQLSTETFKEIFNFVNLGTDDVFYHLGCGDGTGLVVAREEFTAKKVIGIDNSQEKIDAAKKICSEKKMNDVKIICNDVVNENTFDHPYYIKGKGWCSYSPQLTKERYDMDAGLLEVGDICYQRNLDGELEEVEVSFIREDRKEVQTYIIEVKNFNTFFANGILTHNKDGTTEYGYSMCGRQSCFLPDQLINMADGASKKIGDIEIGDMVKGWDEATDTVKKSVVNEIQIKSHYDVYELHLENGKVLKPTGNHPFLTKDKGWTTIDGHDPNHAGGSGHLEVGDSVLDINKLHYR